MTVKREINIQNLSLIECSKFRDVFLFRNQTGVFKTMDGRGTVRVGLNGAADSFGLLQYKIKPEDVGRDVCLFFAAEFKTLKGRQSDDQKRWQAKVEGLSAPYRLIRSPEEMVQFIEDIKRGAG